MARGKVERCLTTNMSTEKWYVLNKTSESTVHRWMSAKGDLGDLLEISQDQQAIYESFPKRRREGTNPFRTNLIRATLTLKFVQH